MIGSITAIVTAGVAFLQVTASMALRLAVVLVSCVLMLAVACDDRQLAELGLCDPDFQLLDGLPPMCPEVPNPDAKRYVPDPNPRVLTRPRLPVPTPSPTPIPERVVQLGDCEEEIMTEPLTYDFMRAVLEKHRELFMRQPGYSAALVMNLLDENGEETDREGIVLLVTEETDPSTQEPDDRVPSCLDGVPVEVRLFGGFHFLEGEADAGN